MTRLKTPLSLPVLTVGLSAAFHQALRRSGLPVRSFAPGRLIPLKLRSLPGRIVVFDSRLERSRSAVQLALKHGVQAIDVAAIIDDLTVNPPFGRPAATEGPTALDYPDVAFFHELKERIEHRKGVWLRLGDYPYPYQSVCCPNPAGQECRAELEGLAGAIDSPADRYRLGLPLFSEEEDCAALTVPVRGERQAGTLLWMPTADELTRWWSIRRGIAVRVWKQNHEYRIDVQGEFGGFRPMAELWRGDHVAAWPLASGSSTIDERQLVFVPSGGRSPGGMTSFAATIDSERTCSRLAEPQSA